MPHATAADGTSLHYRDWGTGAPVVLVHGWPLSGDMWEYQASALAQRGHRVIAYDRRGFGHSGHAWDGYDYNTMADDLRTIMAAAKADNAALVGFSMGGGEVARYMSRHRGAGVSKIALVSAVTPFLLQTDSNPNGVPQSQFNQMIAGLKDDRPTFLAGFGKQFYGAGLLSSPVTDAVLGWTQILALQASPKATIDCVRAFSETDFRGDLETIAVPTLIVHGDADAIVPIDIAGRLAHKMISNSALAVYSGAPHGLFFTHKEQLTNDLLGFLAA